MKPVVATASMLIRRAPAEIFDALVTPETLCRFWLDAASGPLAPGATVTWRFKVPGISDTVSVTGFDAPRRLSFRFSDGVEVAIDFESLGGDATRVAVACSGFREEDLLAQAGAGHRDHRGIQHRALRPQDPAGDWPGGESGARQGGADHPADGRGKTMKNR
jgi:uncharacterized protein YndB with AHSA1/START domain